jgi:DNA-binding NarL/FixJ family response regulator
MGERVKFLIVDDHPIFRRGLSTLLESEEGYAVCGEAGCIDEALALVESESPDIVLLDISLGGENGLDLLKALHAAHPEVRTLVISIHDEAVYAKRALRAHARGYMMKQEASSVLREAISTIMGGKTFVSATFRDRLIESACQSRKESTGGETALLSDRELEVLKRMGQGYSALEIAGMLRISVKTVGVYQEHVKKKLSLETASDLRKYAIRWVQSL